MTPFDSIAREQLGGTIIVRLRGDIDAVNAQGLTERARGMCDGHHAVALDLTDVTYLDSAGVRLIDALSRHCAELGVAFSVIVPHDAIVRRVVELTLPTVALVERSDDVALECDDS